MLWCVDFTRPHASLTHINDPQSYSNESLERIVKGESGLIQSILGKDSLLTFVTVQAITQNKRGTSLTQSTVISDMLPSCY